MDKFKKDMRELRRVREAKLWSYGYIIICLIFLIGFAIKLYFDYQNTIACAEKGGTVLHTDFSKVCAFVLDLDKYSIEFEEVDKPTVKRNYMRPET